MSYKSAKPRALCGQAERDLHALLVWPWSVGVAIGANLAPRDAITSDSSSDRRSVRLRMA